MHNALCGDCWKELTLIEPPYCQRLGIPFSFNTGTQNISPAAEKAPPPYQRARAACLFSGTARKLTHDLKYADRHDIVPLMARLMTRAGKELLSETDCLIPVPLHWSRLWYRRFNQSALLAKRIAQNNNKPFSFSSLSRTRRTRRQVGLTISQRHRNISGAFTVTKQGKRRIQGKRILLIDDILTTGVTIETCTKILLKAGAHHVDVLTFARVVDVIEAPV